MRFGRPYMGRSKKPSLKKKKVVQKSTSEERDKKYYLGMVV